MATTHTSETDNSFGGVINRDALVRYVERIERLEDERAVVSESIRGVVQEAKEAGFQPKILRQIIRERRLDPEVRHDQYALLEAYRRALGMLADTPLGEAAMSRVEAETVASKPRPFAEQPVHPPRRSRKPVMFDQEHPQGTA